MHDHPPVIDDTKTLAATCRRFAEAPYVTVDTEFMRENTYWSRLCLIQMAVRDDAVIIDPMADGIDLSPFYELMADQRVIKVFHAARQDVEIVVHQAGIVPAPLFDTQIAAMVCGFGDQISYEQLVLNITGDQIDKSSRFTDWSRRPLSPRQLAYAVSDVTHLREVYLALRANLDEQNRSHWVDEEMAILTDPETYITRPQEAWRRLKMRRVRKPRQLAVVHRLAAWREATAQARNVPRSRVLKDDAIFEIAQQQPTDRTALARLRTIPRGFERSDVATALLKEVEAALALPEDALPVPETVRTIPGHASAAADLLKVLLKKIAEDNGVAGRIIATVDELDMIAADDDADVPALHGWRRELFGNKALEMKHGKLALGMRGRRVETFRRNRGDA